MRQIAYIQKPISSRVQMSQKGKKMNIRASGSDSKPNKAEFFWIANYRLFLNVRRRQKKSIAQFHLLACFLQHVLFIDKYILLSIRFTPKKLLRLWFHSSMTRQSDVLANFIYQFELCGQFNDMPDNSIPIYVYVLNNITMKVRWSQKYIRKIIWLKRFTRLVRRIFFFISKVFFRVKIWILEKSFMNSCRNWFKVCLRHMLNNKRHKRMIGCKNSPHK